MDQNRLDLEDKVVLLTDGTSDIGFEIALFMAQNGATIVLGYRDKKRANQIFESIVTQTSNQKVHIEYLNLTMLQSVRDFANKIESKYKKLNILINNAGIPLTPYGKTKDGFEVHFQYNYLGHFLLTNLLMELIKKSAPSKIINFSVVGHRLAYINWDDINFQRFYDPFAAYLQSKLANLLFTCELAKQLKDDNVTVVTVSTGVTNTESLRQKNVCEKCISTCLKPFTMCYTKSAKNGAKTVIYCTLTPEVSSSSGGFFNDSKPQNMMSNAKDSQDAERLWDLSLKLLNKNC